jgi:hypothetical protein
MQEPVHQLLRQLILQGHPQEFTLPEQEPVRQLLRQLIWQGRGTAFPGIFATTRGKWRGSHLVCFLYEKFQI